MGERKARNTRGLRRCISSVMALLLVLLAYTGSGAGWITGKTTYAKENAATATGIDAGYGESAEDVSRNPYQGENYKVSFNIDSSWSSGYNASITIENTGDTTIENWCIAFPLEQKISNIWNANISNTYENYYQIKNSGWNQDIPAGKSITFGITAYEAFTEYPEYYTLLGHEQQLKNTDYTISYEITDDWGDGYKAQITITNNKAVALEDWKISFDYGDKITKLWDAVILKSENGHYEIGCETYNQNIMQGQSKTFGFLVEPGTSDADIKNIVVKEHGLSTDATDTSTDKYLALIGYTMEETNELELYMVSSEECSKYEIYISYDGGKKNKIGETEELEYIYNLPDNFNKAEIYAIGYYNEEGSSQSTKIESNKIYVELANGKYTVILPDTDGDGLADCYELIYGSDINLIDSDGDGLDDYYEV